MDNLSPDDRRKAMQNVKSKDTKPELFVRRLVHGMGYRYRLHRKDLPGKPDLVFPGRRKIIFVHGCFWHRHENCRYATTPKTRKKFWISKFASNEKRDQKIQIELMHLGWVIMVIWTCEIKNKEVLVKKIRNFLDESTPSASRLG